MAGIRFVSFLKMKIFSFRFQKFYFVDYEWTAEFYAQSNFYGYILRLLCQYNHVRKLNAHRLTKCCINHFVQHLTHTSPSPHCFENLKCQELYFQSHTLIPHGQF